LHIHRYSRHLEAIHTMMSIDSIEEKFVVESVMVRDFLEDGKGFEETVVEMELYKAERDIIRALESYVPNSHEERRLVRKIDLKLLPILGLMYAVQCMDRNRMVSNLLGENTQQNADRAYQNDCAQLLVPPGRALQAHLPVP
jgi:hypothetical protein